MYICICILKRYLGKSEKHTTCVGNVYAWLVFLYMYITKRYYMVHTQHLHVYMSIAEESQCSSFWYHVHKKTTPYMHIYIYHTNVSCTSLPISYHVLGTNGGGVGRKFGIFEEGRWPSHRSGKVESQVASQTPWGLSGCGLVLGFFFFFFGHFFFLVCGLCACVLSSSRGVVGWCFCGGVVVFLWWCFCGGVCVVMFLWWCFCGGVVVLLCFCGGIFVVVWWCFCVFVVMFWWCFGGGVFVVVFLWRCFCGGVFVVVWWCFCGVPCGGVFGVVFLWWCFCGGVVGWCFCGGVCVVWLCFCGGVVVFLSLWWCFCHCGDVFVLVFLWWCGSAFMFLWWCFCGGLVVFLCFCGGVLVVF